MVAPTRLARAASLCLAVLLFASAVAALASDLTANLRVLVATASAVLCVLLWLVVRRCRGFASGDARFVAAAIAVLVGSRLLWIAIAPTEQISDFAWYHDFARVLAGFDEVPAQWKLGPGCGLIGAWGYPLVLAAIYRLGVPDPALGMLFNVLLGAITLPLLFLVARKVAGAAVARISVALFVLWPSQVLLSSVLASEHLALIPFLAGLLCLLAPRSSSPDLARSAAAGLLFAIAYLVRAAAVSALGAAVVYVLLGAEARRSKLALLAAMVFTFALTSQLYGFLLDRSYGVRPHSAGWWSLMTGMRNDTVGGWSASDAGPFCGSSSWEDAHRFARDEALSRVSSHGLGVVALMWKKAIKLWSSEDYAVYLATHHSGYTDPADRTASFAPLLYAWTHAFHLLALGLAGIGCVHIARGGGNARSSLLVFLVLAASALHMVLESQARYHFVLEPVLFVLAAMGAVSLAGWRTVADRAPAR